LNTTASPHRNGISRRKLVILLTPSIGLSACLATDPKVENQPPEWMTHPPADTPDTYYGLGEGVDLAAAKRAALRDIAGKIRVTVSGRIDNATVEHGGHVSRTARSTLSEEVQKTEFKNYTLVNSAAHAQGVYALLKVDRLEFLKDVRERISRASEKINSAMLGFDKKPTLEQFTILQTINPSILQSQALYQILGTSEYTTEDRTKKAEIDALAITAEGFSAKLSFFFKGRREDLDAIGALSNFITDKGMRVVDRADQANSIVEVSTSQRLESFPPDKMVQLNITLTTRDAQQRIVAGRDYTISGSSVTNHATARQQAAIKFRKTLSELSFTEALGIKTQ
jgi:hypothetical protein